MFDPDRDVIASDELLSRFRYEPRSGEWFIDRPGGYHQASVYFFPFHGVYVRCRRVKSAGFDQILLHRLVAQFMGIPTSGRVVHHVNNRPFGVRWCNREVMSPWAHMKLHRLIGAGRVRRPWDWLEWNTRPESVPPQLELF